MYELEKIEAASGLFVGWADHPGQVVKGYVTTYSADGGEDFNQNPCPQMSVELTEAVTSYSQKGSINLEPGDEVTITCGQSNLQRTVKSAKLTPGDYVELAFVSNERSANGRTFKKFDLGIARNARAVNSVVHTVLAPRAMPAAARPAPVAPAPAVSPQTAPVAPVSDPTDKIKALIAGGMDDYFIAAQTGEDADVIAAIRAAA